MGSASGPIRKPGEGVLSVYGPIRKTKGGGGGGGCARFLAQNEERGRGGGCCRFLARYEGRGGEYDRVSGGPGYSTVVEFMRADINRQRNRAAILYNAARKVFLNGGGGGGGARAPPPPGSAAAKPVSTDSIVTNR